LKQYTLSPASLSNLEIAGWKVHFLDLSNNDSYQWSSAIYIH